MKLSESIVMLNEKHAETVKELTGALAKNGDIDVYTGNMEPLTESFYEGMLYVDVVTDPTDPEKYPKGYLHLGKW